MSKFLSQKRALIEKVYETTRNDTLISSLNGLSNKISDDLLKKYNFYLSYKTLGTYYEALVNDNKDCTIKPETLNKLSNYIGYRDFKDFCEKEGFNSDIINNPKESISLLEEILNTLVSIKGDFTYALSHFTIKQSSWGIFGIMVVGGIFLGKNSLFKNSDEGNITTEGTLFSMPCMYWNESEYKLTNCNDKNPNHEVLPIDSVRLKYFKKITRPDTLTAENALGKVWYSKYRNKVEFFTMDGKNPENGKELDEVSDYILEKYAKK